MSTWITIKNCVTFAPNLGVMVAESALKLPSDEIKELLTLAFQHMDDELLVEACSGGNGPLADLGQISYEDYLLKLKEAEIQNKTQRAKKKHTKIRRQEYSARRSQLILALIDSGVPYVCAHPGCNQAADLTIDHIVPLSKGGTDDLENLQFMCKSHNSSKGDKANA